MLCANGNLPRKAKVGQVRRSDGPNHAMVGHTHPPLFTQNTVVSLVKSSQVKSSHYVRAALTQAYVRTPRDCSNTGLSGNGAVNGAALYYRLGVPYTQFSTTTCQLMSAPIIPQV